jgi:hypothetical protein
MIYCESYVNIYVEWWFYVLKMDTCVMFVPICGSHENRDFDVLVCCRNGD